MLKIILATTSPYRREAFAFLGIPFEVEASQADESQAERKNPEDLVRQLAKLKAQTVAKKYPKAIVIGMDSVGYFQNQILEKPRSKEEAFRRLKSFSGKSYQFYTGVYMVNTLTGKEALTIVKSDVFFRDLSDEEIKRYLEEDPNYKTYAHGYDPVKNISSSFIAKIVGSPQNVLRGIPLEVLPAMLSELDYKL